MANEEEERALENQLELQLLEQQDSLSALNDTLASDPSNPELLSVYHSPPSLLSFLFFLLFLSFFFLMTQLRDTLFNAFAEGRVFIY